MNYRTIGILILLVMVSSYAFGAEAEEYLIIGDIGDFKFITEVIDLITEKPKSVQGYAVVNNSGILIAAGHFTLDHSDITYSTDYESDTADLGVEVQITRHAGAESDKWLLHEVERDFRNYYGMPGDSYAMRLVNDNTIMVAMSGGGTYRWVSGNKVIHIYYTDLQLSKPEPLEVIQAYLVKHPSSLAETTSANLRTNTSKTIWIKDEMERRLWLCDKWFMQLQRGKVEQAEVLKEAVEHMGVFLNYRKKYYGVRGDKERDLLDNYLYQKNGTGIKNRLEALKKWWAKNKAGTINLP